MVALVRRGKSQRYVARRFGVTLRTVQRWVERASDWPLRSVDWKIRSHAPRGIANRTPTPFRLSDLLRPLSDLTILSDFQTFASLKVHLQRTCRLDAIVPPWKHPTRTRQSTARLLPVA